MPYIYKITNTCNDKVYIGQTIRPIVARFQQHKTDAKRYKNTSNIKLYNAMNKYGTDCFSVEVIEECPKELLNEREIYWIKTYNSFHEGYNSTAGGHGHRQDCDAEIMLCWEEGLAVEEIFQKTGHSRGFIAEILIKNGVSNAEKNRRSRQKRTDKLVHKVYQYDLDGNFVAKYASAEHAARAVNLSGSTTIRRVCDGTAQSSAGYLWRRYYTPNLFEERR